MTTAQAIQEAVPGLAETEGTLGINAQARETLLDDWLVEWWDLHIKDPPATRRTATPAR